MTDYDEDIVLGTSDVEVLGISLGIAYGSILGVDEGTDMGHVALTSDV